MILVSTALLKLNHNLIHSSQHKNKFILCKTNILQFLSNILQFLSISFIRSFKTVLDWKLTKLIKLFTRRRGKHVFIQLLIMCCCFVSEDTSYDSITVDKCFIFNFVRHFYESNTNFTTSTQIFICHYTGNYGQKFYINPKIISS